MSDEHTKNKLEWLAVVACDARLPNSATRIAVLLATKFLNRKLQKAWPSMNRIADELGMSRQGAQKSVSSLIDHGYLEREIGGGRRKSNQYRIKRPSPKVPTPVGSNECDSRRNKPQTSVGSIAESANSSCHKAPTTVGGNPTEQPIELPQNGKLPHEMTENERIELIRRVHRQVGYPMPKCIGSPDAIAKGNEAEKPS